jgi:hypothetical protein
MISSFFNLKNISLLNAAENVGQLNFLVELEKKISDYQVF